MNEGLIPRRYAKALYKYAVEKGEDKKVYDLMNRLAESFAGQPTLQTAVANPFVSNADKTTLLTTAAGADKSDTIYADFIKLLAQNKRIDMIHAIALDYASLYRESHNIHVVTVTSATPLAPDAESRLKQIILTHLNGGTMEYHTAIDPALLGGFTVSIGNERLDASIANELKQLRLNLLSK